jgi:hypothetical protein
MVRKIIFSTGPTRAAKAGQKSLVLARQAQRTNQERAPFHLYSLSLRLPQFQQVAGAMGRWPLPAVRDLRW